MLHDGENTAGHTGETRSKHGRNTVETRAKHGRNTGETCQQGALDACVRQIKEQRASIRQYTRLRVFREGGREGGSEGARERGSEGGVEGVERDPPAPGQTVVLPKHLELLACLARLAVLDGEAV